jgi:hypothetical protein
MAEIREAQQSMEDVVSEADDQAVAAPIHVIDNGGMRASHPKLSPPMRETHDQAEGQRPQSWPALIDKIIFSPTPMMDWRTIMALLLMLLPSVLDNLAGRIEDWHDLSWSVTKGLVPTALLVGVLFVSHLLRHTKRS